MRNLVRSKLGKCILTILIFFILFNFTVPTYSQAGAGFPGKLIEHLADLVCSIGDAVMNIMQGILLPGSPRAITKRTLFEKMVIDKDGNLSLSDKLWNAWGIAKTQTWIGKIRGVTCYMNPLGWIEIAYDENWAKKNFNGKSFADVFKEQVYPMIYYSPGAIFANRVPALDVNFLNPAQDIKSQYSFLFIKDEEGNDPSKEKYLEILTDMYGLSEEEAKIAVNTRAVVKAAKDDKDLFSGKNTEKIKQIIDNEGYGEDTKYETKVNNIAATIGPTISKWYIALRNIAIVGLMIVLVYIGIRILVSSTGEEIAKYKIMLKDWLIALVLIFVMHYIMLTLLTITQSFISMLDTTVFQGIDSGGDALMNEVRTQESLYRDSANSRDEGGGWLDTFGYAVMYTVLVIYTLMFTLRYLKRVIYMAFLTIIAPMVALTYPLDKIRDGKAQAYNMWFKEYTYNLLIQPVHLLLYIIFIGSAIDFAQDNILYAIVAIAFLLQAEKFIKEMFGIKAEGGAFGGGFAAGAAFSTALGALKSGASKATGMIGSGKGHEGEGNSDKNDGKVRQQPIKDKDAQTGLDSFNSSEDGEEDVRLANTLDDSNNGAEYSDEDYAEQFRYANPDLFPEDETGSPSDEDYAEQFRYANPDLFPEDETGSPSDEDYAEQFRYANPDLFPEDEMGSPSDEDYAEQFRYANPDLFPEDEMGSLSEDGAGAPGFANVMMGTWRVAKKYGTGAAKFAAKTGLKITGAVTLGTIGVAAGLASDNFSDVLKYGAAGIAGGAYVGDQIGKQGIATINRAKGALDVPKRVVDEFQKGYHGDEYQEKVGNKRAEQDFLKDKNNIQHFKDKYGKDDYKEKMNEAVELMHYGITDRDQIDKAISLKDSTSGTTTQQAATIVKLAEDVTRMDLLKQDKRDEVRKLVNSGVKNEKDQEKVMSLLDKYHDVNSIRGNGNTRQSRNNSNTTNNA